jgi:diguanylate cyclase (GGDEF)-like protein
LAGVLAYYRRDRDSFTTDDLRILTSIAPRIGTAIENALKVKELQERASRDVDTDLPTLPAMTDALDVELIRAKRQNQSLAVIVAQFSGLAAGDETGLREAARVLRTGCRQHDHVARIGDDTFGMILPGMKRTVLGDKLELLRAAAHSAFPELIANGNIRFGIGWSLYPDDADTSKLLLAVAGGRNEMSTASSAESLLALHAHNRGETESPFEQTPAFGEFTANDRRE